MTQGPAGAEHPGSGQRLRPFDRRLLGRVAVARWALAVNLAAGLTGALLLLAQMTLLAGIVADAAQGRLRQVPAGLALALAAVIMARAGLAYVVELSGRRTAARVMSALRAELVGAPPVRWWRGRPGDAATAPSSRPAPSRVSTASRPTSPATCPRSSWRARCPWPSCSGVPSSTCGRPWSWSSPCPSSRCSWPSSAGRPAPGPGPTGRRWPGSRRTSWTSCGGSRPCGPSTGAPPRSPTSARSPTGTGGPPWPRCGCRSCPGSCSTWPRRCPRRWWP